MVAANCTQRLVKSLCRRLPILKWGPEYSKSKLLSDTIAGVTVALTVIPQSLAYAAIAGLSPEYGLYSSYLGVLLYVFLGSCKQVTIGPTAVMGLLTYETCNSNVSCAILAGFYAGVIELLLAILQLGWVVSFIPEPVVIGFTSGAATTIISSQVKNLLGIGGNKGSGFVGYWKAIFKDFSTISLADSILGVGALIILLFLRKLKDYTNSSGALMKKSCWFISVARNAMVVIATGIVSFLWVSPPYVLTGHVQGGFPPVKLPDFQLTFPTGHNETTVLGDSLSFLESLKYMGTGPLIIALISILQNVSISKAFGAGQAVDATQEMLALGIASVASSFVSSIPISGSFSRSAVNEASGVQTPMGGLFTGSLVLLALGLLTPSFYYIPKASLAAVIISAVILMIQIEPLKIMWKIKRWDFFCCILTYLVAIFVGMEIGILIGTSLSIIRLLFKSLRPTVDWEVPTTPAPHLLIKCPQLTYEAVDHLRLRLLKIAKSVEDIEVVVLDCGQWNDYDYSSITAILSLKKSLADEGKRLTLTNCCEHLAEALKMVGYEEIIEPLPLLNERKDLVAVQFRKDSSENDTITMDPLLNSKIDL